MKMRVILFSLLLYSGCDYGLDADPFERGRVSSGEYRNDFFGFSLKIPDPWFNAEPDPAALDAEYDHLMSSYEEKRGMRDGDRKVYFGLLSLWRKPVGDMPTPIITVYCVDTNGLRGVESASDYLQHIRHRLPEDKRIKTGSVTSGTLGGREFQAMGTDVVVIRKMEYAIIIRQYVVVFEVTYKTADELASAQRVLQGIDFDS